MVTIFAWGSSNAKMPTLPAFPYNVITLLETSPLKPYNTALSLSPDRLTILHHMKYVLRICGFICQNVGPTTL